MGPRQDTHLVPTTVPLGVARRPCVARLFTWPQRAESGGQTALLPEPHAIPQSPGIISICKMASRDFPSCQNGGEQFAQHLITPSTSSQIQAPWVAGPGPGLGARAREELGGVSSKATIPSQVRLAEPVPPPHGTKDSKAESRGPQDDQQTLNKSKSEHCKLRRGVQQGASEAHKDGSCGEHPPGGLLQWPLRGQGTVTGSARKHPTELTVHSR